MFSLKTIILNKKKFFINAMLIKEKNSLFHIILMRKIFLFKKYTTYV